MPARDHAVVRHRGQGDRGAGREGGHVAGHEPEQLELPGDQQASPDEHCVRHDHPHPHRDPPQVLRLGVLRSEHNEGQDERDVGGVEDMPSLPADEVLRGHGEGDHADEDVNPVLAPPSAVYLAGDAQPARRRSVDGRHGLVTDMVGAPLHRRTPLPTRILAAAAALLALAACEPAFGLGLPSETALEEGAANTLTHAKTFGITGTYSLAGSVQWTIDLQVVRPGTAHAIVSTSDQKVEAVITGDHAYFRGQKFLAAHMAGDPQSQNLARAAGNSWWKGPPGYIPAMKEFTDGAAFRTAFLGSANTHRTDHLSVD